MHNTLEPPAPGRRQLPSRQLHELWSRGRLHTSRPMLAQCLGTMERLACSAGCMCNSPGRHNLLAQVPSPSFTQASWPFVGAFSSNSVNQAAATARKQSSKGQRGSGVEEWVRLAWMELLNGAYRQRAACIARRPVGRSNNGPAVAAAAAQRAVRSIPLLLQTGSLPSACVHTRCEGLFAQHSQLSCLHGRPLLSQGPLAPLALIQQRQAHDQSALVH